jgi:hypothetical protein
MWCRYREIVPKGCLKRFSNRYCAGLVKPFSEEEQADRRRPWQKREGLRRIAVLIAAPTGVYALLVVISLLGGPRIGAPLILLPDPGGADAVNPVAGPPSSGPAAKVFPAIPPDTPTAIPVPTSLPTAEPSDQPTEPPIARPPDKAATSTTKPQAPQTVGEAVARPTTGDRPTPTKPPTVTTPPPRPTHPTPPPTTPPPTTPSDPPGRPDHPQPPTLADILRGLIGDVRL